MLLPLVSAQAELVPVDTVIKLELPSCGGDCPAYTVSIDVRGVVSYEGLEHLCVKGRHTGRIPFARVAAIVDTAHRLRFFELADRYRSVQNAHGTETIVTGLPTTFVTVREQGRSKRIEDSFGAAGQRR